MSHPLLTSRLPAAHDPAATWLLILDNLPPPAEATPAATLSALTDSILLTAFLSTSDSPDTPVRLYAANLHSSTLQPFLATSSKSTADYYTLLYNALTKIDFADATQHVQLTLNLDPLTNLPVTDPLRVSFAQQMYLARLADQQAQYLDVIAKHQAEVAAFRQARQVALDELMVFAWAAREREDAMLLKFQALLNEKKRKVRKVQAENRKLKLAAAGSSTGFADQTPMDVDQPGMVQTARALSPTAKTKTVIGVVTSSSTSSLPAAEPASGGGKQQKKIKKSTKSKRKSTKFISDSSDNDDQPAAKPTGPVPPGILPPGRLEFPVLPMQQTRIGPARTLSGGVQDPLPLRSNLGIGTGSAATNTSLSGRPAASATAGDSSGSATESGSEFDLPPQPRPASLGQSAGPSAAVAMGAAGPSGSDTE